MSQDSFTQYPIGVRSVDLSQPLQALTDVTEYMRVRVYVMQDDHPLGYVEVANDGQPIGSERVQEAIGRRFSIGPELAPGKSATLPANISVSVVVATYDRPDGLRACLRNLMAQQSTRPVEIVVVDNHPASGVTPAVVAEFGGVVLVREPRQGLAYARNAGFAASSGAIVVTTDDDVTIPPTWLEKLIAPFARPDVMATTGNVLPAELTTAAQQLFEVYGGLGRGFDRKIADARWFAQFRTAVPIWHLGATANAAFRASIFQHPQIGLMEETLGPGMPSGVGEDAYLFYKILQAGYTIVYEPAAYVWHTHRRTMVALRRQLYDYSKGHVAYHLTTLLCDRDQRAIIRLLCELPLTYLRRLCGQLQPSNSYPLSLLLLELAGNLAGPWALWQSRRRVKREGHSEPYTSPSLRLHPVRSVVRADRHGTPVLSGYDEHLSK